MAVVESESEGEDERVVVLHLVVDGSAIEAGVVEDMAAEIGRKAVIVPGSADLEAASGLRRLVVVGKGGCKAPACKDLAVESQG